MKNWTWVCVFMCVWVRRVKCIICFLKASKTRWGLTWSAKTWTCPLTWRSSSRARSCCPPTSKPGSSLWPSSRSVRDNEDEVFLKSDPSEVYNHVESTVLKLYLCYTICILRCALGALMLRCIWCHRASVQFTFTARQDVTCEDSIFFFFPLYVLVSHHFLFPDRQNVRSFRTVDSLLCCTSVLMWICLSRRGRRKTSETCSGTKCRKTLGTHNHADKNPFIKNNVSFPSLYCITVGSY